MTALAKLYSVLIREFSVLGQKICRMGHFQTMTPVAIGLLVTDPTRLGIFLCFLTMCETDIRGMRQVDLVTFAAEMLTVAYPAGFYFSHAVGLCSLSSMDDEVGTFRAGHDLLRQFFGVAQIALCRGFFPVVASETTIHVGLVFASDLYAMADIAMAIGTGAKSRCELAVADPDGNAFNHFLDGRRMAIQTKTALDFS